MDKVWVGSALRRIRMLDGRSIQEIADELSVTDGAVSSWELGATTPTFDRLDALATFYEMSIDTLLDRPGAEPLSDWYLRRRKSHNKQPLTTQSETRHKRMRPGGHRKVRGVIVSADQSINDEISDI